MAWAVWLGVTFLVRGRVGVTRSLAQGILAQIVGVVKGVEGRFLSLMGYRRVGTGLATASRHCPAWRIGLPAVGGMSQWGRTSASAGSRQNQVSGWAGRRRGWTGRCPVMAGRWIGRRLWHGYGCRRLGYVTIRVSWRFHAGAGGGLWAGISIMGTIWR